MIVVIGLPAYRETDGEGGAGGLAVDVAVAARLAGSSVELAGKIGDDAAGDAVVLGLGRTGVGHAALLRDPARPTPLLAPGAETGEEAGPEEAAAGGEGPSLGEGDDGEAPEDTPGEERILPADPAQRPALEAGDVSLGLEYLAQAAVVVLAEPLTAKALAAVAEGAAFSGAQLVVLVPAGSTAPQVPAQATVLETPPRDDGSFARLVGAYAAGLDRGSAAAEAFSEAVASVGWEPVSD